MDLQNDSLTEKLRALRDGLSAGLVERDLPVRLALLAALAGEHLLLLGPPGTAKSLVARRLHLAFKDSTYFERLLTRFTVPEELFGPLSIKGLEQDRYERLTQAYLPTASIAFLDEIFKANSAILNSLLTLLNEREFDNGASRICTPLVAVVGASNELPEAGELDALFDRFLLRLHVSPVTAESFPELLALRGNASPQLADALLLSPADLAGLQELAEMVELPDDVVALLCEFRDWCTAHDLRVSDRRWRKLVKLLQVSAFTNGREQVSVWDCWLVQHCLWNAPEEHEKVYDWYAAHVGASAVMNPARLTRMVTVWEGKLKADQESRSQLRNAQGLLLYVGPEGNTPQQRVQKRRGKADLFLAPANSYTARSYYSPEPVGDRTNGGKGYTRDELKTLHVGKVASNVVEFEHWADHKAYLGDESNWLMDDDLQPAMEPTRQKTAYIAATVLELDVLHSEVESYQAKLLAHIASLEAQIQTHLWVMPAFVEPASESLKRTRQQVETLLSRIAALRNGFARLPRERDDVMPVDEDQGEAASASPEDPTETAA